jgi:hypothetical protein
MMKSIDFCIARIFRKILSVKISQLKAMNTFYIKLFIINSSFIIFRF